MQNNPKIPEGWSVKKLGNVIDTFSGGTPLAGKSIYYENGTIPFIRSGEIYQNYTELFITEKGLQESSAKMVNKGDLLFALYGANSGEIAISQIEGAINQAILCIRPKEDNIHYLKNSLILLKDRMLHKYLQGGQGNLSAEIVKSLKLLFPPLPEQEKVALVLGMWDEAIEKLSGLIEQKKLLKKGLMQELLTGKTRLPGFTQPWKEVKLGSVLESISRRNKNLNTTRVLSVTNSRGFVLPEEQFARVVASEDLSNYKIVKKGEFAYNPSRLNVGSIDRLDNFTDGVLSPMYVIFKCNEQLLSDYMKHWITTTEFNSKVRNSAQGSVRETVDFKTLSTIKIRLPSDITEQHAIADILSTADDEINLLNQKLEAIKEQKKGLMQQLLTGQIRAKVN